MGVTRKRIADTNIKAAGVYNLIIDRMEEVNAAGQNSDAFECKVSNFKVIGRLPELIYCSILRFC